MQLISVVFLVIGLVVPNVQACERMNAALRKDGEVNLFFGNYYTTLDEDGGEVDDGHTPDDWMVFFPDAAFTFSADHKEYFFSGSSYFTEDNGFNPESTSDFGDFFKDGIDAAGNLNGSTVFFKGCQYVKTLSSGSFTDPKPLPKGLPCNVDAAVTEGNDLLVFKDDQSYLVDTTKVHAPVAVEYMYDLSKTLCAKGEDAEADEWK